MGGARVYLFILPTGATTTTTKNLGEKTQNTEVVKSFLFSFCDCGIFKVSLLPSTRSLFLPTPPCVSPQPLAVSSSYSSSSSVCLSTSSSPHHLCAGSLPEVTEGKARCQPATGPQYHVRLPAVCFPARLQVRHRRRAAAAAAPLSAVLKVNLHF